jgi:hypothetical protein
MCIITHRTKANKSASMAIRWASFVCLGLRFFPDGSIGTSLVIGTYDAVPNSGSNGGGYYSVTFADGSELWLKWTGDTKVTVPGKFVAGNGTAIVIGGKGRYEDAKGKGTFTGEMVQPGPGAIQYIDNVINIKK